MALTKSTVKAEQNIDSAQIERERLTSLINSMADGVIAIDDAMKVVITNGAALNVLDVNKTLIGAHITKVIKLVDKNSKQVDIINLISNNKVQETSRDWLIEYPDGSKINLYISIAPVHLGYGKQGTQGHVLLLRDITREKSLEEERDEFISVVSHELRTPIAIAEGNIGNAEFLFEKSEAVDEKVTAALHTAHEQVVFLAGMMNDLATLSRAERGKLSLELEPLNAHELIKEIATTYKGDADAKQLTINTRSEPELEVIYTGKLYAKEILQNFMTNAIKYTEEGIVTIGARSKDDGIEFYISDTGIGLSKADKERVFDKFFRSEDFRTRANNGTGLGLYVTMKLARILHAEMHVESELNKGSTFSLYLPNLEQKSIA